MTHPLRFATGVAVALLSLGALDAQAQNDRLTIEFDKVPLRDVIVAYSRFSGRTIIVNSEVDNSPVTAEITNQPWEVSLRSILEAHGLTARTGTSNTILVDRRKTLTVTLVNASLRQVVANIATFAGRTIIMPGDVADAVVNASIEDADWKTALDDVLRGHSLIAIHEDTGMVRVARRP